MQCSAGRGVFVVCIVCAYVSVLSHLFVNIMTGCRTKIKESCKNYLCILFPNPYMNIPTQRNLNTYTPVQNTD